VGHDLRPEPGRAKQALQKVRGPDHLAVLEGEPQVGDTGVEVIQKTADRSGQMSLVRLHDVVPEQSRQRFFLAVDYGFAFGGRPDWGSSTLSVLPDPFLSFDGTQRPIIAKLRRLTVADITSCIDALGLPRFGLDVSTGKLLARAISGRASFLVAEYDRLWSFNIQIGLF
jgi:hypothetical protein